MAPPIDQNTILDLCLHQKDRPIIFDIGACEGESSIGYKSRFPISVIHSFEPLPDNIELIKKNIKRYGYSDIFLNEVCLSDIDGFAQFNVSSGIPDGIDLKDYTELEYWNKSSSLLNPGNIDKLYNWLEFKEQIQVQTVTLENYCSTNGISAIDFIHMDVQGAELLVLNGAGPMLNKVNIIWMEVSSAEIYEGQPLKEEVNTYMKSHGFEKILDIGDHITGDELWLRNEYLNSLDNSIKNRIRQIQKSSLSTFKRRLVWSNLKSILRKLKSAKN